MKRRLIAWLRSGAIDWVGEPLAKRGITANQITVAGALVFAAGFMIWMVFGQSWWGLLVAVIGGTGDFWDGSVAKAPSGRTTPFGNVLDSWTDRAVECAIWGAIGWVSSQQHHPVVMFGCFTALGGSFLVSYSRERGEKLGVKGLEDVGLGDRFVRLIVIGAGVIAGHWLGYSLVVLVINGLAWSTAVERLLYIRRQMEDRPHLTTLGEALVIGFTKGAIVSSVVIVAVFQSSWLIWT